MLLTLVRRHLGGLVGLLVLMLVCSVAILAPYVAPHDPSLQSLQSRNLGPVWLDGGTWTYPLGTDGLGRDILSRLIWGARVSILVGFSTAAIQALLGIVLGLIAGYYGGGLGQLIMRVADIWLTIPFLVLALAFMAVTGPGIANTILVLSLTGWVTFARVVRGQVLAVRENEYVTSALSLGARSQRILAVHVLPNLMASIIVLVTLQVSRMIIAEASLSYLGLGIQPPDASWGSMVAAGRDYLFRQWWIATMPGMALLITTMSLNSLGDSLRDAIDPTLVK